MALGAWLELIGEESLSADGTRRVTDARCLLQDFTAGNDASMLFDRIGPRIAAELREDGPDLTILVDHVRFGGLDPLGSGWDAAVAMMILAFPEITWKFGISGETKDPLETAKTSHTLASLLSPAQDPLFDGTGLREHVRKMARKAEDQGSKLAAYIPRRERCAIAMDDEVAYSFFNGYTAYRFGFRAYVLRRFKPAEALLGENAQSVKNLDLTFEDIYLNFPDKEGGVHLSHLGCNDKGRVKHLPGLSNNQCKQRVFISSSQTVTMRDGQRERNRAYIRSGADTKSAREVQKPLSGMFDLRTKARLKKEQVWTDKDTGKTVRGVAENYHWPPPKHLMQGGEVTGHGSPGRLLQVAESLIERAEQILSDGPHTVRQAVTGAVLATDALELLGDRTPTTATQALDLKHNLEVTAECQFSGVEYHIEIQDRLDEIEDECEVLAGWFHPDQKNAATWNAEMHIVNRLVRILRENNQFDEEALCMNRVRGLHNRLWTRQKPFGVRTVLFGLASYASWLMASFGNFVISFFACIVGLGTLHFVFDYTNPTWDDLPANGTVVRKIIDGIENVFPFFVGANEIGRESVSFSIIFALSALLGLIHLGIFLSFLYSVISRKS